MVCVNYIMKHLYLLIAATFLLNTVSAQSKCAVLKANAYYTLSQPGNIQTDENGRQLKPVLLRDRFIYITTSCSTAPKIISLKYGKKIVPAAAEKIPGSSIVLAKNSDGEDIYFKAAKGTTIWKINAGEAPVTDTQAKPDIYLKILISNKTQIVRIYAETLLLSPDRP